MFKNTCLIPTALFLIHCSGDELHVKILFRARGRAVSLSSALSSFRGVMSRPADLGRRRGKADPTVMRGLSL